MDQEDRDTTTIFYYQPKYGRRIGCHSKYKIERMIEQEYGHMAHHRDVGECPKWAFKEILNGEVHNDEWN